jgi:hypothetical protein
VASAVYDIDPDTARDAAANLFILCFPLVLVDAVRAQYPMALREFRLAPDEAATLAPGLGAEDHRIVLTSAWVDLATEPVVIRAPHSKGRYFALTLIDNAGEAFASLGTRTGDDTGLGLALVGPRWNGDLPSGLRIERAPADQVWLVSRIRAHSALDMPQALAAAKAQRLAALEANRELASRPTATSEAPCPSCLRQAAMIAPQTFFHRLEAMLDRAPAYYQKMVRPAVRALGAELGGPPNPSAWSPDFTRALASGFGEGIATIQSAAEAQTHSGRGWREPWRGASDTGLARAVRVYLGLGASAREDLLSLVCDHDELGRPLSGDHRYRLHFQKGALPPAEASWWLSAAPGASWDGRRGLGDRSDPNLNPDGSLDLIIQKAIPSVAEVPNWIPIAEGPITLTMRLFGPSSQALSGAWRMPSVGLEAELGTTGHGRSRATPPAGLTRKPTAHPPARLIRGTT